MAGPSTRTGDFSEISATARPFSIEGVSVVIWQKDKFVHESHYSMTEIYRQRDIKKRYEPLVTA